MKILLTGGAGLLSLNWAVAERDRHEIVLGYHDRTPQLRGSKGVRLDLTCRSKLRNQLAAIGTELVVHTAGLTNVDYCESHPKDAANINTLLAGNVASACSDQRVPIIHISTDHLFPGHTPNLDENATCEPVNWYGRSKADAEKAVIEASPAALVLRTNFFGWGTAYRRSISDWILDGLRKGQPLDLFEDVFFTPIHAGEVAIAAMELHRAGAVGIFHVVGDERVSKYEFGCRLARRFNYNERTLRRSSLALQQGLVQRPMDLSLSNRKACSFLKRNLGDLDFQIEQLVRQASSGISGELGTL